MKLMVIDGNSIINRAFYGIRMLNAKDGTPTNAVYGFINMLHKAMADVSPDGVCVTFDLKGPTFRHKAYEGYKAQRKGMPDDLAVQLPILKEVLDAMNIRRYELEGYEADDLIGTIAKRCADEGYECVAVTGDKDSFQLISEKTSVLHIKSRMGQTETKLYTRDAFFEEYGFEPVNMIDLKALMGDTSDNIPGVPGVGEKTAMGLVQKFGTVKNLYDNIESADIKEAARKKLIAGKDMADMSYNLAEICCCAPVEFNPRENLSKEPDNDKLYEIMDRLGFKKLIEKMGLSAPMGTGNTTISEVCREFKEVTLCPDEILEKLKTADYVSVSLDEYFDSIAVCADCEVFAVNSGTDKWDEVVNTLFSAQVKKAGHNVKSIMRFLIEKGISCEGWIFDTAVGAYLLDPMKSAYELSDLAESFCGYIMKENTDENGQFSLISDGDDSVKLKEEAKAISLLKPVLEEKLKGLGMEKLFYEIEMPMCRVLASMEHEGFLVDKNALSEFGKILSLQIDDLQKQIYELAGEEFNINSPKQLGVVLFENLMLPAPKKTKTGWSTNIDVLEKLRSKHPIINLIIDYRQLTKLKSTYADGLLKVIAPDGKIHTNFQMTVTATGRLSSTEPNLQNIPVRRELGSEIRKMFVAGDGNILVDADYSQIELRLLAHISKDETMIEAFKNGEDIHAVTASQVFGTPLSEVTSLQRSRAKAVNFGIVYGISAFSLSQDIGVTAKEAKFYMDSYLEKYSGVKRHMDEVVESAKNDGFVTTEYGRRRNLNELKSSNHNIRAFGERVALNMPIQGTAADIMKIAMIRVFDRLEREMPKAKLILQVHDELIVECPEGDADRVKAILKEEMESAAILSVPLTADTSSGKSWYEAK